MPRSCAASGEPREDIHFHPLESRSFRLTLIKNW
jgi:hypothetical protein